MFLWVLPVMAVGLLRHRRMNLPQPTYNETRNIMERTYQGTSWNAHTEKHHGTQTCWLWFFKVLSQSLIAFCTCSAITASYLIVAGMEALDLNFFKSVFSLPVRCLRMTCKETSRTSLNWKSWWWWWYKESVKGAQCWFSWQSSTESNEGSLAGHGITLPTTIPWGWRWWKWWWQI